MWLPNQQNGDDGRGRQHGTSPTRRHAGPVGADGSAFPVLPQALRPATAKAAKARAHAAAASGWPDVPADLRKSKNRTAELAGVADIPPAPRTAHDVLTALFGPPRGADAAGGGDTGSRHGPKAQGKTLFASARKPIPAVIRDPFAEARRGDPGHGRPWFALVDGNNAQIDVINALAAYKVKVPILIDLIHVVSYLWKAAGTFFYPGDPEARAWVRDQAAKILDGKHRDVRAGIRRRATTYGYSPAEREGADATGLIEGAARWLMKHRMEDGGRWSLDGADAVLKLRALVGNGDFDDCFAFHLKLEKQRNHHSRYQQPEPQAA